jgi:hypothetical protein
MKIETTPLQRLEIGQLWRYRTKLLKAGAAVFRYRSRLPEDQYCPPISDPLLFGRRLPRKDGLFPVADDEPHGHQRRRAAVDAVRIDVPVARRGMGVAIRSHWHGASTAVNKP